MMAQMFASLLFAAGFGVALFVLVGMLRGNADVIVSALMGRGAFGGTAPVDADPTPAVIRLAPRHAPASRRRVQRLAPIMPAPRAAA